MDEEYRVINIGDFYEGQYRQNAAMAVLAFLDAKEYSFSALDGLVQCVSGTDDNEESSPEQLKVYEETFNSVADFLIFCGADQSAVEELFESEDADRAQRIANFINENPSFQSQSDYDLITTFIAGNSANNEAIEEGLIKKVVDGKVKWVKKKLKKKKLSSAQRAGLKKARRKANSPAAKRKRAKSNKTRKKLGLG